MKSSVLLFSLLLAISFLGVVNGGRELKQPQVSTEHVSITNMTKTAQPLLHPNEGHDEERGDFEREEHHRSECDDDCDDDDHRGDDDCDDCHEGEHDHDCDDCDEGEHDRDDCDEGEHDHDCEDCDNKLLHGDKHAVKNQTVCKTMKT